MARTRKGDAGAGDGGAESASETAETAAGQVPPGPESPAPEDPLPVVEETAPIAPDTPRPVEVPEAAAPVHSEPQLAPARSRRGGFFPTVLGGAVAAGLGFGAAVYVLPRVWTPEIPAAEVDALKEGLSQQAARLDALSKAVESGPTAASVAELSAALTAAGEETTSRVASLGDALGTLDARLAALSERLDGMELRLSELEKRPVEGGAASALALDAFGREMEALRAEMAAQKAAFAEAQSRVAEEAARATESVRAAAAEADRLRAEAEETARKGVARAALGRVEAALTAGGALDPALADLRGAGVEIPQALAEQGQGVPTLDALRAAFPQAARSALAVSLRETADGSMWDRLLAFLRTQSGARSLSPREGMDPDAVLSRAEAALSAGDLGAAIDELGNLPADGQARMAEWTALAKRRTAATEAAAVLAAELK